MLQMDKLEFVGVFFQISLMEIHHVFLYSRLLHLDLLRVSLFVVQLGLQTDQLFGLMRALMSLTALLLPFFLMVVEPIPVPLAM